MFGIASIVVPRVMAVVRRQEGQGLAEYALILALVAMVAISGLIFLGEIWAMPDITATPADAVEY